MERAKTFSLGDAYDGILSDLVKTGRFETEADAMRAGIRLLADHEMRLQSLRASIASADAEIGMGEGIEYEDARSLLADVMRDAEDR